MDYARDEKGRFIFGHDGRKPPGSPELKKKVLEFIDGKWQDVPGWFDSLKPKDKLLFIGELLPYPCLAQVFPQWLVRKGDLCLSCCQSF